MAKDSRLSGIQRGRLADTMGTFLNKRLACGGTVQSDGTRLYSYMVVIGEWDREIVKLPESKRFYSRTTTRHRNMLKDMATTRGITVKEE